MGARTYLQQELNAGDSRVFNCLAKSRALQKNRGAGAALLFRTRDINNVIVIKDTLPPNPQQGRREPRSRTKLYFPYDPDAPEAGGPAVYAEDSQLVPALSQHFGLATAPGNPDSEHDLEIIDVFRGLPTVDPFLFRDRLETREKAVDELYLRISEQEWQSLRHHILARFRQMVDFAYGEADSAAQRKKAAMLVEKIWDADDTRALAPILAALNLEAEQAPEVLYAWKGILFYERKLAALQKELPGFMAWLRDEAYALDTPRGEQAQEMKRLRQEVAMGMRAAAHEALGVMGAYNRAYDELFVQRRASGPFVAFMQAASSQFWTLGGQIARLDHVLDIWRKTTQRRVTGELNHDALAALLGSFTMILKGQ